MTTNIRAKRPPQLLAVIIILYIQAVFNAGGGILVLTLAAEETEHGREAPELYALGWVSVVIGIVLLGGAILLTQNVSWARLPVTIVEGFGVASGVVAVVSGVFANVINIALCILVLVNLFHYDVRAWFAPRPVPDPQFGPQPGVEGSPERWGTPPERHP